MSTQASLWQRLRQIDQHNYKAYKDLCGSYEVANFTLLLDRIQGNPVTSPSQCLAAIEAGDQLLLVDEDTAATNFMIRDRRMQALIAKDREPITPFIDKVRQLYTDHGVSTILVVGGSGDYFDVAATVIAMQDF